MIANILIVWYIIIATAFLWESITLIKDFRLWIFVQNNEKHSIEHIIYCLNYWIGGVLASYFILHSVVIEQTDNIWFLSPFVIAWYVLLKHIQQERKGDL